MSDELAGKRILIVEDSPMVASFLEETLRDLGCIVAGPTGNMAIALELADREMLDAAIIDVNIRGAKVFPVAQTLSARNVPFLLASGYADWTLPEQFRDRPRLAKPFTTGIIEAELRKLLGK